MSTSNNNNKGRTSPVRNGKKGARKRGNAVPLSADGDSMAIAAATNAASKSVSALTSTSATTASTTSNGKRIYLIRHGESEGQVAKQNGMDRKREPLLLDAGLTRKGIRQATEIPLLLPAEIHCDGVQLVVTSPLTRAVHTALLGFGATTTTSEDCKFIVRYDLCEGDSSSVPIPENIPRPFKRIISDLSFLPRICDLDHETYQPDVWPPLSRTEATMTKQNNKGNNENVCRGNKKQQRNATRQQQQQKTKEYQKIKQQKNLEIQEQYSRFVEWLAQERTENAIAIVCHYNVIRGLLGASMQPQNGVPIPCTITDDGRLTVI